MADRNSFTLVVDTAIPANIPQGYTLKTKDSHAVNMV